MNSFIKYFQILILNFLAISAYSQNGSFKDSEVGSAFKGFVIMENNDTVKGIIKVDRMYEMQYAPTITPEKQVKYVWFTWEYVKYYQLDNSSKWYSTKFYNIKAPADDKRKGLGTFLLVHIYGPITVFHYNLYDPSIIHPTDTKTEYIQFPNGEVVMAPTLAIGFRKKMSEYVKDYPELATKIANKEKGYGVLNVYDIINEYNSWYLAKNPNFNLLRVESH